MYLAKGSGGWASSRTSLFARQPAKFFPTSASPYAGVRFGRHCVRGRRTALNTNVFRAGHAVRRQCRLGYFSPARHFRAICVPFPRKIGQTFLLRLGSPSRRPPSTRRQSPFRASRPGFRPWDHTGFRKLQRAHRICENRVIVIAC